MTKRKKPTAAQWKRIDAIRWHKERKAAQDSHYGVGASKPVHHTHNTREGVAGTFGPAGPCRRIDPKTGDYLD